MLNDYIFILSLLLLFFFVSVLMASLIKLVSGQSFPKAKGRQSKVTMGEGDGGGGEAGNKQMVLLHFSIIECNNTK